MPGALLGALFVRGVTWWLPGRLADPRDRRGHARRAPGVPRRARRGARRRARRAAPPAWPRRRGISRARAHRHRSSARPDAPAAGVAARHPTDGLLRVRGARRRARRRARCSSASTSTSTPARSSRSSAPTAPASRRCSTRSPASHRPSAGHRHHRRASTPRARAPEQHRRRSAWPRRPAEHGVFPTLTRAREPAPRHAGGCATARRRRAHSPTRSSCSRASRNGPPSAAGDLSGGEQQMLTLAMALVARRDCCSSTS